MSDSRLYQQAVLARWEREPQSEWVEKRFGRRLFAHAWEAYAGGDVADVYTHRQIASRAFFDTLHMLEVVLRAETADVKPNKPQLRIRFASGGTLRFLTAVDIAYGHALEGVRLTRLDGAHLLPPSVRAWLPTRVVELL